MARVPHIAYPVRFVAGQIVTVDQDSVDEVLQAVRSVLAYRPGQRTSVPDFGTPDQAFVEGGADLAVIREAIERWEPRALARLEADPSSLDDLVSRVVVEVGRRA